jgi:hypothetical protein
MLFFFVTLPTLSEGITLFRVFELMVLIPPIKRRSRIQSFSITIVSLRKDPKLDGSEFPLLDAGEAYWL